MFQAKQSSDLALRTNRTLVHTLQSYNLKKFRGPIDLNRGSYQDNPLIVEAQRKLYGILQEDQVVWCEQTPPNLAGAVGRYLHEIEVDNGDIVAIIYTLVWCHIIGEYGPRYIPPEDRAQFTFKADTGTVCDEIELRRAEDEYLAKNRPVDLWSGLIKSEVTKKSDQVLIRFPFIFSTIVDVRVVSEDMAKGRPIVSSRKRTRSNQ